MRQAINLNQGWQFTGKDGQDQAVHIPHTWNNLDGQDGGDDYYRGQCSYVRTFPSPAFDPETQQVYLQFKGVNSSATVLFNDQEVCTHHGGYSTFRCDITDQLKQMNTLQVLVDNSVNDFVYPQKADFTFYGGIYRDVHLLVVSKQHFDLDHFGGPGVKITPQVEGKQARITVESYPTPGDAEVRVQILDATGLRVAEGSGKLCQLNLTDPHLWQGLVDPYLYTAVAQLVLGDVVHDEVRLPFGIRSFHVDPKKGFFLNGKPYPLHGVSRHQDRRALGNALTKKEHDEDLALILEVGANSIRLAHYQHDQYFYDRCDQLGFIVWAEIPYISEHLPKGRDNTISQMKELIVQNHHHASIVTWGISNEITISTKDKRDMLDNHRVLHQLSKEMDPTRLTSLACYAMLHPFAKVAHITDLVGWNLYLGWYVPGFFLNDLWIGFFHLIYPNRPLSYSEYGCEGMPNLHAKRPRRNDHTEEYQAKYHEYLLRCFERHPYMWSVYVWNMFDFAADARDQGGEAGMNHKGLVTFDRKIKKDSFYLYKAFWSQRPFVHIAGKRMQDRTGNTTRIAVYTNQPQVSLYVDGQLVETRQVDKTTVFTLPLKDSLQVKAVAGEQQDEASFRKVAVPNPSYKLQKIRDKQKSNWV